MIVNSSDLVLRSSRWTLLRFTLIGSEQRASLCTECRAPSSWPSPPTIDPSLTTMFSAPTPCAADSEGNASCVELEDGSSAHGPNPFALGSFGVSRLPTRFDRRGGLGLRWMWWSMKWRTREGVVEDGLVGWVLLSIGAARQPGSPHLLRPRSCRRTHSHPGRSAPRRASCPGSGGP